MTAGQLRPLGFLCLMVGFGLRLDSTWQLLALVVLALGGGLAAAGLIRDGFRHPHPRGDNGGMSGSAARRRPG
jgi:hypothetical protein